MPPEVTDVFSVLVKGSICMMVNDKYRLETKVLPLSTVKRSLLYQSLLLTGTGVVFHAGKGKRGRWGSKSGEE